MGLNCSLVVLHTHTQTREKFQKPRFLVAYILGALKSILYYFHISFNIRRLLKSYDYLLIWKKCDTLDKYVTQKCRFVNFLGDTMPEHS